MIGLKRIQVIFLQIAILVVGMAVLVALIRLPLKEGRAATLDLWSIYSDPLIVYVYAASIAFFVALYKAFQLLRNIEQNKLFTPASLGILRSIKYCAILLSILILIAGIYISVFHDKEDDPAGFIALSLAAIFIALIVAATVQILETVLQNVLNGSRDIA